MCTEIKAKEWIASETVFVAMNNGFTSISNIGKMEI